MFSKTAVTVIQAFSYDFSTQTDLVWKLFNLPWTPRAICHGCQIVHSDPLNTETSYPKKNLFGLCENAVSVSNTNAIFKNRSVPTNPFISQHLHILDECRTFRPLTFRPRTFRPGHFGHGHFGHEKKPRWTFRPKPQIMGGDCSCVMHLV